MIVKKKIYDKLLSICISLFFNKREKFFKLLRKDITINRDTLNFWDNLNAAYDQLKDLNIMDQSIAKTFLHKLLDNEQISSNILTVMKFNFKNDQQILNYFVDFELSPDF